jgi:flavin reductase (DIM6/NTAB) family NADH-FMN oxidoreductase RutF
MEVFKMRKNIKTTEAIFPMPVLMIGTYNEDESVDVMNAAWGMMIDRNIIALNLTETHKTVKNIKQRKAFTVSIANSDNVVAADYLGIVSGNNTPDKFANTKLTATKSENVDAPIINEFPICMECEFIEYQDGEFGAGVIGKVVNVTADENVMNGDIVDISKVNAIAFDPYTPGYYKIGERVGDAFREGNKLQLLNKI